MASSERFLSVPSDELPHPVSAHLIDRAAYLGYTGVGDVDDFNDHMRMDFEEGYSIYAAVADRTYGGRKEGGSPGSRLAGVTDEPQTERTVFLVDFLPQGDIAGHGEVTLSLTATSSYSKDKPLVLGVETHPGFTQQGYGHRRYLAMNAASLLVFGFPLHSRDATPLMLSASATRRWEALVREGLAESYEEMGVGSEGLMKRYRFK